MKKILLGFFISISVIFLLQACETNNSSSTITGVLEPWNTVTLTIEGPNSSENDIKNPFLDYRFNTTFTNGNDTLRVPGFFAADGNASESSAFGGNIWKVRFAPPKEGEWQYLVSFREGKNIAVNDSSEAGYPLVPDGISGRFFVRKSDKAGPGFLGKGRLRYTGGRYLQHEGTDEYFIKGGADSPENFLAYEGFDNTPPKHTYEPHIKDWMEGDPVWKNSKGKGIIGALNYLASKEMNVVYFLTMNVQGDGDDVFPWTDRNERYRFDCSKLDQWEIVFNHFDKLGILLHVVTQENENQVLLDAGFTDVQRKLYYRELVARFSHHPGLVWNMGEENGPASWFHNLGQSVEQRIEMAAYLRAIDPYKNLIVFHTMPADPTLNDYTVPLLGNSSIDGLSLQVSNVYDIHEQVKKWIRLSSDSSRQWVVNLDEIGPWFRGVVPDSEDPGHDTIRSQALWGTLMAGGAGTEWYFGPEDLTADDFRKRDMMWDQTRIAMNFFKSNIPFYEMESRDELVLSGNAWCLAKKNEIYAFYMPAGGKIQIDLSETKNDYSLSWFNPRRELPLSLAPVSIKSDEIVEIGPPPQEGNRDWVAVLRKL